VGIVGCGTGGWRDERGLVEAARLEERWGWWVMGQEDGRDERGLVAGRVAGDGGMMGQEDGRDERGLVEGGGDGGRRMAGMSEG
jgi:hypothetical protein